MKLIKRFLEKDRSGYVTLIAEDPEDMWVDNNYFLFFIFCIHTIYFKRATA